MSDLSARKKLSERYAKTKDDVVAAASRVADLAVAVRSDGGLVTDVRLGHSMDRMIGLIADLRSLSKARAAVSCLYRAGEGTCTGNLGCTFAAACIEDEPASGWGSTCE